MSDDREQVASAPARPVRRTAPVLAGIVGVVLAALLVVLALADPGDSDSASSPLLGKPAPEVESSYLDGGRFDLSTRRGSWVVLNFFNSTCVPCRNEHPYLIDFWADQEGSKNPAELYTIINDDNDAAVRAYFAEKGGGWPIVRDDDGAISVAFGVAKVPETWVVDPDGFVVMRVAGALSAGFLQTRLAELKNAHEAGQ